jgi:SRSO17 transposase
LQQFVNQSPWPSCEVRASLARKVEREFVPEAYWLIDEVSFPKQGKHSVGVARQYCGALGKTANCQVAVSLDLGTEESSTPLNWALYLPKGWVEDPVRRKNAGIPEEITFKTKIVLALDLIDEAKEWGLQGRLVLADSAYGDAYDFRQGLRGRKLDYVVQASGQLTAWTQDPHPAEPPKPLSNRQGLALGELEADHLEGRNQGALVVSFCSGARLDGQRLGARQDDGGAKGRTSDRMAGG